MTERRFWDLANEGCGIPAGACAITVLPAQWFAMRSRTVATELSNLLAAVQSSFSVRPK